MAHRDDRADAGRGQHRREVIGDGTRVELLREAGRLAVTPHIHGQHPMCAGRTWQDRCPGMAVTAPPVHQHSRGAGAGFLEYQNAPGSGRAAASLAGHQVVWHAGGIHDVILNDVGACP